MPTLAVTGFNIVCSVLGTSVTLFGLVSYLLKERYYLSEACKPHSFRACIRVQASLTYAWWFAVIALLAGLLLSPLALNFVRPLDYAHGDHEALESITLNFTRLVLGIQLFIAGIQLPRKYLWTEWKSLALLLGPVMTSMWICTSLVVWALVPNLPILHAMAVAACVTPTDPVLSNSIVKGEFADKNIPKELQKIIIAESGANDGLGYPFLFLALYLIRYTGSGGQDKPGSAVDAIGLWFGETWGYIIILSVVYGVAVGWIANKALHRAEEKCGFFHPTLFNPKVDLGA